MKNILKPYSNHTEIERLPEWMTFEIQQALEAITGAPKHLRKKRVTVLRVAQALAADDPLTQVWSRNGACSKGTWYGEFRHGQRKPGWRDEPEVQYALELARRRAEWWLNVREGRALERTLDVIVDAAPAAAAQLARMATQGIMNVRRGDVMVDEEVKAAEVIKAINSLLDRADSSTASKGPSEVAVRLTWGEVESTDNGLLSDGDAVDGDMEDGDA